MKIRTIGLLSLLSLAFAMTVGGSAQAAVGSWQQGVSIQPTSASDFASSSFQQSVSNAQASGVDHITLIIPVYQTNIHSTDVAVGATTPTDQSLSAAASYIKGRGMSVGFAIHVNPYDYQWRALINPNDRAAWFANYGGILNRYASLAQNLGVGQFVMGTELSGMTDPSVNASNTENWIKLIQNVRSRYSGIVTYSAQHSNYKSDLMSLGFWSQLDRIGISAYYGLDDTATPSVENVKTSWDYWNNNQVRVISDRHNKPVIFTEIGYVSRDHALRDPGSAFALDTSYNAAAQAVGYQALFEYWNDFDYVQGISLWDWKSNPSAGGEGDRDYTPQGKPAEQVMKQWFSGGATAPEPTPTPAPAPAEPASYVANVQIAGQPVINSPSTIATTVTATQPVSGAIVDVEIYNAAGQRVDQRFYENQSLSSSNETYHVEFTPTATGEFTVKVGVFTSGWQENLYWNDSVHTFSVVSTAAAQPTQPAPSEPVPSEPAPSQPAPQQPETSQPAPTAPVNVSIWWPGEGVTVTGTQPFKASVDGYDVSQYKMYWQVDGGALNLMGEGTDPVPHKLSHVDLTNWKWNASQQYTLKFIVNDLTGKVIGERTVVITVS